MPENDIYNNKKRYEQFINDLELILIPPEERKTKHKSKHCKNKS